jgi:hypothetical protein
VPAALTVAAAAAVQAHHSNVTLYDLDCDAPNASAVRANGWNESTTAVGETVTVKFRPARNPDFKGGYGEQIVKSDGRTLDFGGTASN